MNRRSVLFACLTILLTVSPAFAAENDGKSPCGAKEYHQFDFWIGEWRVETPTGKLAGMNSIQRIVGGCAIEEHWRGSRGMTSISVNSYDERTGHWRQSWFDSSGGHLELEGEFRAGRMVMSGEGRARDGSVVLHQLTWIAISADRVRQLWQRSSDGGRTWHVTFDGIYIRRK